MNGCIHMGATMFCKANIICGVPVPTSRFCCGDDLQLKRLCCRPVDRVLVKRVGEIDHFVLVNWVRSGTSSPYKKSQYCHQISHRYSSQPGTVTENSPLCKRIDKWKR